jgi:transposase
MVVGLAATTPSQSTRHRWPRLVLAMSTPSSGVIAVESPEQDRLSRSFPKSAAGEVAQADGQTLNSRRVGALPILDRFLRRLGIAATLGDRLPREDRRWRVSNSTVLLLLARNLLISREPLYGVGQWAARHEPSLLGLSQDQLAALNDDRVGRALDRLFDSDVPSLVLDLATHAVGEFDVNLDELHNDSTTVTFHGDYDSATQERTLRGQFRAAITWGHNKDHRPDLKQLLYILTVTGDGAVPVQFRVQSGNTTDDRSHRQTWDFLRKLTGRADFLYVADCKLATAENMAYLHNNGGRFVTVLPRTRGEDAAFRATVQTGAVAWRQIHEKRDDRDHVVDTFSISETAMQTTEGYRMVWYHSTLKAQGDAASRMRRLERAVALLDELRRKLASPRTRYRERAQVSKAVEAIVRECEVEGWLTVEVKETTRPTYRQERRGRPGEETRYKKQERTRFEITHCVALERLDQEARCDGVFPLVSNDLRMTERELLLSYKHQPAIERRFKQLKTDFAVAPVYLKEASRIQALLCVYFVALLVEALLERELRGAMERSGDEDLPLYPESRPCRRPTARKLIDLFEDVQRHTLTSPTGPPVVFTTELTRLQRKVLRLLGMPDAYDF